MQKLIVVKKYFSLQIFNANSLFAKNVFWAKVVLAENRFFG